MFVIELDIPRCSFIHCLHHFLPRPRKILARLINSDMSLPVKNHIVFEEGHDVKLK